MRLLLMLLMSAVLLVTANVTAAPRDIPAPDYAFDDLDDEFDEGGYDGAWHTVKALDVEIFLPVGWTGEDIAEDGACYRARSADGAAALTITCPADGATAGEVVSANGRQARLTRGEDGSLSLTVALSEERLAGFRFERASEEALPESLALQIAGSCTDVW